MVSLQWVPKPPFQFLLQGQCYQRVRKAGCGGGKESQCFLLQFSNELTFDNCCTVWVLMTWTIYQERRGKSVLLALLKMIFLHTGRNDSSKVALKLGEVLSRVVGGGEGTH